MKMLIYCKVSRKMTAVSAEMEPDSPISRGSSELLVDRFLCEKRGSWSGLISSPLQVSNRRRQPRFGNRAQGISERTPIIAGVEVPSREVASGKNARCDGVRSIPYYWALPHGGLQGSSRWFWACDCPIPTLSRIEEAKKWRINI